MLSSRTTERTVPGATQDGLSGITRGAQDVRMKSLSGSPAALVQRQLDAYNAKDVEALLATYATDAEWFEHPSHLIARGTTAMKPRFEARFAEAGLKATLINRIVAGHVVVDHEIVRRCFPEGPGELEIVMIYEVRDGRIAKSWILPGRKTLDRPA